MTLPAAPLLTADSLSENDEATRVRLLGQLSRARRANARQESYYEGSRRVQDLGIAIPPNLADHVEAVVAWPEIVVDVIDERMDWRGWYTPTAELNLSEVYTQNHLSVESGQAVLDSLIYGLSYMTVGTGRDGEPEVLVKAESPLRMTGTWDPRLRRLTEAVAERYDTKGSLVGWTLYLPAATITTERRRGKVVVVDRDDHGLDRVPVAVLPNRSRTSRMDGRSEITRAVRSLTNMGMRTLLGMEVSREFYGAPQRWLMGADENMFVDENGNPKSQWEAVIGKMLVAPRGDPDNPMPQAGQFNAASPQPFTNILQTLAQMLSAATGLPASHLGFNTDNPASAPAIEKANDRLDKRAIRRAAQYDLGMVELGMLSVLWRDGELPPLGSVQSLWGDPSTPTPSSSADRVLKLSSGDNPILPPDSDVALEQAGFSTTDISRIGQHRRRKNGNSLIDKIRDNSNRTPQPADPSQ